MPRIKHTVEQIITKLREAEVALAKAIPSYKFVARCAYSDPSRPLIPTQVGHPFRRNAATDSDRKSATISSLLGIGGRHPSE